MKKKNTKTVQAHAPIREFKIQDQDADRKKTPGKLKFN